ncbi:MAG: glutamate-1-semialdehyde 2,1-aminomutase [Planctomycetota bacterium]
MAEQLIEKSELAFAESSRVMPGGVSSPVRAYGGVGGTPIFIAEGEGCRVTDVDGNTYIDYVMSYGPLIAGHANERVMAAVCKQAGRGTSYGMPTSAETTLCGTIASALPGVDMVRLVNSGTEAAMSAIRLARAATGRNKIVKCAGCYHGHVDGLLVEAGSGALTLGTPSSPGVPETVAANTLTVPFNDLDAAAKALSEHGDDIACFAVEPIAGNMGLVPPADGYLAGLRELCNEHGVLLLFDEVMTGFRVAWGGAQVRYEIEPDLTCLGKVIGGGLPLAAYAGPKRFMEQVSPAGPMYQAGTLSGNPLATAAGITTLDILAEDDAYEALEQRSAELQRGLESAADNAGVPLCVNRVGSMVGIYLVAEQDGRVVNFADATATDADRFAIFFHAMREAGVLLAPSRFEALFVSLAHDEEAIEETIAAAEVAFAAVKRSEV